MRTGTRASVTGIILLATGVLLLLVSILGHVTHLGDYPSAPPRSWEQFDSSLAASAHALPDLVREARQDLPAGASEREVMSALYEAVIRRFTHAEARHGFFGNWILYLAGWLHPVFGHIWDPGLMVARGHSLQCDQSSYLLLKLAMSQGIRARHVGLHGHVVMEAWYGSDWHLYDPDLEIVPLAVDGRILGVEQLAADRDLLQKYYQPHAMAATVASREDNTYVSYPSGARFEWKANLLARFERWMEVVKFLLPLAFVVLGAWIWRRQAA